MSGYKRVSFYELCRLCASSIQKEKINIFEEDGRKIQLQNKIQTCLSLTVNENDFLPKVVCSKCIRQLDVCYTFREECVSSESMLSSYFKNFRYTEDFKKSGKVYIKDTKPSQNVTNAEPTSTTNILPPVSLNQVNLKQNPNPVEVPFYTLQLPAIVTNPNVTNQKNIKAELHSNKTSNQNQLSYNFNLLNASTMKNSMQQAMPQLSKEVLSNVVVNSNGEVINIGQIGDLESMLNQASVVKKNKMNKPKRLKKHQEPNPDENTVTIDLTSDNNYSDVDKYDKLPHIKSTHISAKYPVNPVNVSQNISAKYPVNPVNVSQNQTVIFPVNDFQSNYNNFNSTNNAYNMQTMNNSNVICNNPNVVEPPSSVNLNVLNQTLPEMSNQNSYSNVMSTVPTNSDNKNNVSCIDSTKTDTVKTHICEICQKSFKRREHLYQHIKLHTGFRPYVCDTCNKAFMRKEHLIRHMTLHSGQKNYACEVCNKSFSRNDNLLKHKKTHGKQSSYTCEICQKVFVMRHYYEAHKSTHGDKCFVSSVWGALKT